VRIKGLIAGLNEGQSFGCESEVSGWGEVGFVGAGVSLVEVVIAEIWMRVGSCDEDACDEKPDGCNLAAQFRKACSGGKNCRHVEKASLVSSERQEMPLRFLASPSSSKLALLMVSNPNISVSNSDSVCCGFGKFSGL
jgi:hypothetical protein